MTTDPHTDWGHLFDADAFAASVHTAAHLKPDEFPDPHGAARRAREAFGQAGAWQGDDDAAEVIAEDVRDEQAARVARYLGKRDIG